MEETREARLERRLVRGMSQSLSPTVRQQHGSEERSWTAPRHGSGVGERSRKKFAEVSQKHAGPRESGKLTSEAPGGSGTSSPTTETEKSATRTADQSEGMRAKTVSSSPTPEDGMSSHNYDINRMLVDDVTEVFTSVDAPYSAIERLYQAGVDGPQMEYMLKTEASSEMCEWLDIEMDVWSRFRSLWERIQESTRENTEEKNAPILEIFPAKDKVTTLESRVSEPEYGSTEVVDATILSSDCRSASERAGDAETREPGVKRSHANPESSEMVQAVLTQLKEMEQERGDGYVRMFGAHTEAAERRIAALERYGSRKSKDADSESSDEEGEKVYAKDVCHFPKEKPGNRLMSRAEWRNWVYQASNWCTPESSDYADRIMRLHDDARIEMTDLVKGMSKAERKMDAKFGSVLGKLMTMRGGAMLKVFTCGDSQKYLLPGAHKRKVSGLFMAYTLNQKINKVTPGRTDALEKRLMEIRMSPIKDPLQIQEMLDELEDLKNQLDMLENPAGRSDMWKALIGMSEEIKEDPRMYEMLR